MFVFVFKFVFVFVFVCLCLKCLLHLWGTSRSAALLRPMEPMASAWDLSSWNAYFEPSVA